VRTLEAIVLVGVAVLSATSIGIAQSIPVPVPSPRKQVAKNEQPLGSLHSVPAAVDASAASAMTGIVAAFAAASWHGGFDVSQRALADRVSRYLSSVHTLTGNFVQVGPDGARTEGQFYIQKPGKVRFEYKPPSPIDIIADGSSLVVLNHRLATQDLYPLSQTPLRYLLVDRIDLLRDTNVTSVSADDKFVTLVIEEKYILMGTYRLLMMFGAKDFQLRQWTVTDPQGYDTTVIVYNLDGKIKPDPDLFKINYERNLP